MTAARYLAAMLYDFVPLPERKPLRWPNGKRLALLVTLNLEYWELTQDHDGPYFPGGPSINERLLAGAHPRLQQPLLARIRPPRRHLADLRYFRRGQGAGKLHRQWHPVRAASADRQSRGPARLGVDRAQLHPDRIHGELPRRPREGKGGDPARARSDREDRGQAAEGLAVVVAPLHGQHLRHLQGARADLSLRLHERRAALSHQDRARPAGVDALHPGGQRHRHVPAPQPHRRRGLRVVEGRVRRALPRRREKRPDDERRPASAHHRPRLPRPRHPRIPGLCEDIRRRVVDHPRGDRGLVSAEPQRATSASAASRRHGCGRHRDDGCGCDRHDDGDGAAPAAVVALCACR